MIELKPTDELAADALKRFVQPLEPGQKPFLVNLMDETNRWVNFGDDWISGCTLTVVFVENLQDGDIVRELTGFRDRAREFEKHNGKVVVICASSDAIANAKRKAELALPFPILGDAFGGAFAAYGLHKGAGVVAPTKLRTVLITPYRIVRNFWDIEMTENHAALASSALEQSAAVEELKWSAPHAPVLIVPQVFTPDECAALIREFESKGALRVDKPKPDEPAADYKLPTYEHSRQDRVDHVIKDPAICQMIDQRLHARVIPQIKHAYAFDVTRREDLHIARYSGSRGGNQIGHRDNKSATQYRRFALSVNLNEDFEGGEVVFREFSERGYKNPAGSAMVFSSSLLHEVLETKRGVRYNLISHFFNDASLQGVTNGR